LLQPNHTDNNWGAMAAIARMILQEGVKVPTSYNFFREVTKKAQPLDILSIIPDSYDINNGHEENFTAYIEEGIKTCCQQVTMMGANLIVDLALLLIDRIMLLPLADIGDQAVLELGLVFIVLVAGHACGRSHSIQSMMDQDCLLNNCYKQASSTKE